MEITHDGYKIPEPDNEDEMIEAIRHNTELGSKKWQEMTSKQQQEKWRNSEENPGNKKAPRGYARGGLKLDNYIDNVETFWSSHPFFYDRSGIFWRWNKQEYKYEQTDETDMMNLIDAELGFAGQTVNKGIKSNYLEAFKRVGRKHLPEPLPAKMLQFKDILVDITTLEEMKATPLYFACNPLPWKLGITSQTPTIDKLITEWVGPEYLKTMHQIIAYSAFPAYPIHVLFAMVGSGRNGKSSFIELLNRFTGRSNVTSTELDVLLDNRFESAKLYKKLLCIMGETNFSTLSKTSLLKKLTGQDLIGYEFKNKNPFDDYNYAKIIIASNSLPSSNDTSDGFYRRWLIINFPNEFNEGKDILETIPEEEYEALARKSIGVLSELLDVGHFHKQGTIEDRKERYIKASNPLIYFLQEECEHDDKYYIKSKDLYAAYVRYLQGQKKRIVGKKEFNKILGEEGFYPEKCHKVDADGEDLNTFWVVGLRLAREKRDNRDNPTNCSPHAREASEINVPIVPKIPELLAEGPKTIQDILNQGITFEEIAQAKGEGVIFESPAGTLRLV